MRSPWSQRREPTAQPDTPRPSLDAVWNAHQGCWMLPYRPLEPATTTELENIARRLNPIDGQIVLAAAQELARLRQRSA